MKWLMVAVMAVAGVGAVADESLATRQELDRLRRENAVLREEIIRLRAMLTAATKPATQKVEVAAEPGPRKGMTLAEVRSVYGFKPDRVVSESGEVIQAIWVVRTPFQEPLKTVTVEFQEGRVVRWQEVAGR